MSLRPSESDTLYYELMALYNASRERERELTAEVERLRVQPEPSLLGRETVREAQSIIRALAEQAKEKCDGCRLSWKLKDWRHREPLPITCEAKIERQAIRALASLSPLKE